MPLIEILVSSVGPAIAKTVLKLWAGDNKLASEGGDSAIEALTQLIPEVRARNEATRQLDAIGERAAESLVFTFEAEGKVLMIEDQEAVAKLVAETLDQSKISAELLIRRDLDPVQLAQHFISEASERLSLLPGPRGGLFIQVIEEASQSIIDIARVLPNFTERTFAELLKRNRILLDAAERTLDSLDRIRQKVEDDSEAEAAKFETEYRRAVSRNLDKTELFGVDLSPASKSHPLSVAYVSLDLSATAKEPPGSPGEIDNDEEKGDEDSGGDPVETILARSSRLLIKGPAGAGKTTLFHWISVRAASKSFEPPLEGRNSSLPFLVRLRQFAETPLPRPEQFPSLVAPTIADTMPRGWVHSKLKSGHAVVMVDGVDEVAEPRRNEVENWIKDLIGTFPECQFIVTSRPHAVEESWLRAEGFDHADLQPMDTKGIETFINHWHLAVAEEARHPDEVRSLDRLATNLKSKLRGNRAIRHLATNPLLCSVICALHRDTNEQLPEDRLDLYERCCLMLLERRDPESGLRMEGYPRLNYRQKRFLLDDLAYWMVKNAWSEIALESAQDRFDKKIETFRPDEKEGVHLDGQSALRFFLQRSGILREPVKGRLDFAHRTFQEFMAANAAITEGDVGVLLGHATNPQWREVVVLGSGLARPKERAELISSLLSEGDKQPENRPQLHLLAAACLDTAVDADRALRVEVENRIRDLFPPNNLSAAMQIADAAGEMAVPFLKRSGRYQTSRQDAACVRALSMIGSLEAAHAIAEYADDVSSSVQKEVARASDRIEPDLFLEFIAPRLDLSRLSGEAVARLFINFGVEGKINFQEVTELSLSMGQSADLFFLKELPNIRVLRLSGLRHSTDLSPLSRLSKLEGLIIDRAAVDDFSVLKRNANLRRLQINRSIVNASQLAGMAGLESLSFSGSKISNQEALTTLPDLRFLGVYDTELDTTFLKRMKRVDRLSLFRIGDGDLSGLGNLNQLKYLSIFSIDLGDVRWMSRLISLEEINLYNVGITDSAIFPKLPLLKKLNLGIRNLRPESKEAIRLKYPNAKFSS